MIEVRSVGGWMDVVEGVNVNVVNWFVHTYNHSHPHVLYIFCVQIKTHITLFCWHLFSNTEQIESIRYPYQFVTISVGNHCSW